MATAILFRAGVFNGQIHMFVRANNTSICGQVQATQAAVPTDPNTPVCRFCSRDVRRGIIRRIP